MEYLMYAKPKRHGALNDYKTKIYQLNSVNNYTTSLDGTIISTETAFNPSATMSADSASGGNNYSTTTGYISGGWGYTYSYLCPVTYGVKYATDTTAVYGNCVVGHTYGGRGINFADAGYTAGGGSNTAPASVYIFVQKISFSTDVTSNTTNNLPSNRCFTCGVTDYKNGIGYFLGGIYGGMVAGIFKFTLNTELATVHTSSLATASTIDGGMETADNGYCFGGYATAYVNTINRISFSTGATSVLTAVLGVASTTSAGGNSTKFIIFEQAQDAMTPCQIFTPSTEVISNTSLSLSEARAAPYCCNA